jgi:hypothetical protein
VPRAGRSMLNNGRYSCKPQPLAIEIEHWALGIDQWVIAYSITLMPTA